MDINKILWFIFGLLFSFMFFLTVLYYNFPDNIIFYTILTIFVMILLDYTVIYINKKHNKQ